MIRRLFKIVFIIMLISQSILSFAAISVSDGSAFVTKAEFSADLNNLSTRLAQMENSIDSKIDSLVSTYLQRNGVWSGKKQTLSSYKGLTNSATKANILQLYTSGRSANFNNIVDGKTAGKYVLIQEVDKSGLINITGSTTGNGISINPGKMSFNGYYLNTNGTESYFTGHSYFRDAVRYYGSMSAVLYLDGTEVFTQPVMKFDYIIEECGVGMYQTCWYGTWNPVPISAYFFVEKGNQVQWNLIYNSVYAERQTSNMSNENIRGSAFKMSFDNAIVY